MKRFVLLFSAVLLIFSGCSDNSTAIPAPYNHWKYGDAEVAITHCKLISYGDAENNGTYYYEFILSSGEISEEKFLYFKLGSSTEELADGIYAINPDDSRQGSLMEAGHRDLTTTEPTPFTAGSIEIRKSGEDTYNITFSFKDGSGIVISGYYDGEFEFSDQTPEPGMPLEVSNILVEEKDQVEFSELTNIYLVLGRGDSEIVLGTWIFTDGGFNIILPASFKSDDLMDVHEIYWQSELMLSSERGTVRLSPDIHFYGYNLDRRMGEFIISDPGSQYFLPEIMYMYSDGNITVNGRYEEDETKHVYDLTLVKGWNMVFHYYVFNTEFEHRVTTDIPRTVAWVYVSHS